MMKLGAGLAIIATLASASASRADTCEYFNTKTDTLADGPCKIERPKDGYRLVIQGLEKPVVIKNP